MRTIKTNDENREIKRQLGKCASSVAANYRAACRARSEREFYSKICIVVEEADETIFWLEVIEKVEVCDRNCLKKLYNEGMEILQIMSKSRKTLGDKFQREKSKNIIPPK